MSERRKKRYHILEKLKLPFLLTAILLVSAGVFYVFLRENLLQSYQRMGTSATRLYTSDVETEMNAYTALMRYGTESIDVHVQDGETSEEIRGWISKYCERLQRIFGENAIDPYVVYQGDILAANPWEGDESYSYQDTEWYQKALSSDGEVIFTDVYVDAIYRRPVITMAQKCQNSDTVFAFDIFPENIQFHHERAELSPNDSIYICDRKGRLIYADTAMHGTGEEVQQYVNRLCEGIRTGELEAYDAYVTDLEGSRRGVYYDEMNTGWLVIITVPFESILAQLNRFVALFGLVMLVGIVSLVLFTLRNLRMDYEVERTGETIRALSNSYYALYRINYEDDTYEMIKGSDYVRSHLPLKGSYPELLKVAGAVIEPAAFREFRESFSSESIRNLVSNDIRDFGGDFQRLFGDEYRWVNVRVLFDEMLSSDEAVLSFREVEQEKRGQLQERKLLEDALASSRQSEKSKQAFFNNMSHDMRTPLNAILGLSDLLLQNAGDEEKVRSYVERISYSSRQLLDLVNDILEMSRLQRGKVVLNNQSFNLRECVCSCAESFRPQAEAEKKQLRIICGLRDTHVMGDAGRMGQILNNLLSNAFKFTSEGDSVTVEVRQLGDQERTQYQIVVRDTGMGMSQEFLPHLFEPYARETRFSSRQINGTGLGMPIVKSLVTQMSGQIYVDSRLGEGTAFTLTIPFLVAKDEEGEAGKTEEKRVLFNRLSLEGRKILLAEDNLLNMEIATEILKMNGLELLQAWNGAEAVEIFRASAPFEIDAILMDMQMPVMDGCEAARRIRALNRPDAGRVPIVAVTANAFAEDIAATTAAGMDAHISKPIDFEALCKTLAELVGRTGEAVN